tara:strand:- start:28 stop:207 length:180 start_codon:yes stop_codon:yes gene_type:complete
MIIRMVCRFCKIVFEVQDFEQIKQVQSEDCYITRTGIKHELRKEGDSALAFGYDKERDL